MSQRELDYEAVRRRVIRRWVTRVLFYGNVGFFLIAFVAGIHNPYDDSALILWAILLFIHYVLAFNVISRVIDRTTRREIERLRRQGYTVHEPPQHERYEFDKAKRDRLVALADDGELEYLDETPPRAMEKSRS